MKSLLTYRVYFPVRNVVRTSSCSQVLGDQKKRRTLFRFNEERLFLHYLQYHTMQLYKVAAHRNNKSTNKLWKVFSDVTITLRTQLRSVQSMY